MATCSSSLAWRIPLREEPGRLTSMGSQTVGHNCAPRLGEKGKRKWREERKGQASGGGRNRQGG